MSMELLCLRACYFWTYRKSVSIMKTYCFCRGQSMVIQISFHGMAEKIMTSLKNRWRIWNLAYFRVTFRKAGLNEVKIDTNSDGEENLRFSDEAWQPYLDRFKLILPEIFKEWWFVFSKFLNSSKQSSHLLAFGRHSNPLFASRTKQVSEGHPVASSLAVSVNAFGHLAHSQLAAATVQSAGWEDHLHVSFSPLYCFYIWIQFNFYII